jgi:hypothetical protein
MILEHQETPLNSDYGIKNERQVCKVGTVWGYCGGRLEEMKVREHG